ncbi:MAG: response regulator [Saprospiraceae bacterium]|nr:response regulator [Saprospiraceae bacterium]
MKMAKPGVHPAANTAGLFVPSDPHSTSMKLNYKMLCSKLFLLLFLALFSGSVHSQTEITDPFITNYSTRVTNSANGTNWWAEEGNNGLMYFANNSGILEYDGATWRLIESPGTRALTKDSSGTIYVGGYDALGYLAPGPNGQLEYRSLMDKLPLKYHGFGETWEAFNWQGKIVFRSGYDMYIWDGHDFEVISSEEALHVGAVVHDRLYQRIWNVGLTEYIDGEFVLVPGGEKFANERIYAMLPYDDERMIIAVRNIGFFLFDGQEFTPFITEADDLVSPGVYGGATLDNDRFVFNSFSDGAYIIDKQGKLLHIINESSGLQNNTVTFSYLDSRGVLWLPLFNGISSINTNSSFTKFGEASGLPGIPYSLIRHQGILYVGSNNGVYYYDDQSHVFVKIEDTYGQYFVFQQWGGRLYTGSSGNGLIEIKGKKWVPVRESFNYDYQVVTFKFSEIDSNRMYVALRDGLSAQYFDPAKDQFVEEFRTDSIVPNIWGLEEDSEGRIWSQGTSVGQVDVMEPFFSEGRIDPDRSHFIHYDTSHGLSNQQISLWKIDGEIAFGNGEGQAYMFDATENAFEKHDYVYSSMASRQTGSLGAYPMVDRKGHTWMNAGKGPFILTPSSEGGHTVSNAPFKELQETRIWRIYIEDEDPENTVAWFSGPDGVIRYEGDLSDEAAPPLHVQVRSFSIGDSLMQSGQNENSPKMKVDFSDNSVSLSYAAPFFIDEENLTYQTRLNGLNSEWSDWTTQTERSYNSLPPGDYTFEVQAKNVYGDVSAPEEFSFTVAYPWYRTWWAYLLYLLAAYGLVRFIVRQRTQSLRQKQVQLEATIDERTAEVRKRVDELATVNRVSQAITEKLDLQELIQFVGDQIKGLFNANIAYVAIHDTETDQINFPYQVGDSMEPLQYGEGLTSRIIASGEPLLINKNIDDQYNELGITRVGKSASSYLGVPIPVEDTNIGVLSVQSTEQENRFNDNDKRLLNTVARHVGIALHNAELFEEAQHAKAIAEDANESKSAFLSTVSHELRTPLTSVLGFAKIIRKRLEDRVFPAVTIEDQKVKRAMKQVSENLGVVVSEGERLTTLINDVLDLAKIESGRMDWNMKPVFMQDVISRATAATTALFEQKGLTLTQDIASDLPLINGDEDKLIQVVINLLSNSVKFTDKGTVSLQAYQDKGQIIVEIQDTGIGIAEDDKHKVFERFRQAGDTLTDKPQGTGLGLPICREIIQHHGGIIWLESELGVGSTFFFSMPVLGEKAAEAPMSFDRIVSSIKKQITAPAENGKPRILIVDDDASIRSLLNQNLAEAGYTVQQAANGRIALDSVRNQKPDLIILDVMMPEMNGFDLAAILKNDPATMDIPIIILSVVEDHDRGLGIGVDRYLTKPIDGDRLFNEVHSLLEQGVSTKKVLVIDQDESAIKTLSEVLSARGYNVFESDAEHLLEKAVEAKPDIIMLRSLENGDANIIEQLKKSQGMENVLFFTYQ